VAPSVGPAQDRHRETRRMFLQASPSSAGSTIIPASTASCAERYWTDSPGPPIRYGVWDDVWNKAMTYHALKPTEWRSDRVEIELRSICARNNLDCILPTAQFRQQAARLAPVRLYLVGDPHWSREGHELVGRVLAEHILRR